MRALRQRFHSSHRPKLWSRLKIPEALKAFERALNDAASEAEIAPRRDGTLNRPRDVLLLPGDISFDLFPARLFGDLAAVKDHSLRDTLKRLGAPQITAHVFKSRVSAAALSVEERVNLIQFAVAVPAYAWPGLLVDGDGRPFADEDTAYPPRSGDAPSPTMPPWAETRFIAEPLWNGIEAALGLTPRVREALRKFNVEEYSFEVLLRRLSEQGEKEVSRRPDEERLTRRQLLTVLAGLRGSSIHQARTISEVSIKARDQTAHSGDLDQPFQRISIKRSR